ncbi:kinase-like domain-containing protein [Astrocystis sublimbata]|nr:kinase-like domain-containing protein [Astrocystis sublimbata]
MDPYTLWTEMKARLVENWKGDKFLPDGVLDEILTESAIRKVLQWKAKRNEDEIVQIVAHVLRDDTRQFKKVFAILVMIHKPQFITYFIAADINDANLPLECDEPTLRLFKLKNPHCHRDEFCEKQWLVLAPLLKFTQDKVRMEAFDYKIVLPFLKLQRSGRGGEPGDDVVCKVQVHPSHAIRTISGQSSFTVKFFRLEAGYRWEDERNALERFDHHQPGHEHRLKLLLSFKHKSVGCFLVFPFIETTLDQFWHSNILPDPTYDDIRWLLRQCLGLATVLQEVHGSQIGDNRRRHGDIKPGNILYLTEPGTDRGRLIIADPKVACFFSCEGFFPRKASPMNAYQSPEYDVPSNGELDNVSDQRLDVWSLGCLFLEFAACYLHGYSVSRQKQGMVVDHHGQECQSFADARYNDDDWSPSHYWPCKFFNTSKTQGDRAYVKESVTRWIKYLHSSKNCSEAIHAVLNLIEHHMLCPKPTDRFTMKRLVCELTGILSKCSSETYCFVGAPVQDDDGYTYPPFFLVKRPSTLVRKKRWWADIFRLGSRAG